MTRSRCSAQPRAGYPQAQGVRHQITHRDTCGCRVPADVVVGRRGGDEASASERQGQPVVAGDQRRRGARRERHQQRMQPIAILQNRHRLRLVGVDPVSDAR